MKNVLLTPEAERDLEEIGDYIAEDNPARAVSFVQEVRDQCTKIGNAPLAYTARPELGELIEHSSVETNRNELTWCVAERRAADAMHGLQLRRVRPFRINHLQALRVELCKTC